MSEQSPIVVGKLGRPRGIHGEIYVTPFTDFPERFEGLTEILVRTSSGWETLKLVQTALISGRPVLTFEGVSNPEQAAQMTNRELAVPRDQVVQLPEGRHYIFDLIGCQVFDNENGQLVGELVDVRQLPANDVYVIEAADGTRHLLAAVRQYVKDIDLDQRRISIGTSGLVDSP
ncbi:MAG: ribosome maturation factor RimM [bacterium]